MGLDWALAAMILIGALRGWFKGFVSQAVRIGGFLTCFYLADPVRDLARPYVLAKLPTIDPGLMDRILWWTSAVVSYIALVGLVTLVFQLMQSAPEKGEIRSRRGDRFGGLLLGAAKSLLAAALLVAAFQRFAPGLGHEVAWIERQTSGSKALEWSQSYRPVPRLWAQPVVRRFVAHIQRNGLKTPLVETDFEKQVAEREPGSEADRSAATLEVPIPESAGPSATAREDDLGADLGREIEQLRNELRARGLRP